MSGHLIHKKPRKHWRAVANVEVVYEGVRETQMLILRPGKTTRPYIRIDRRAEDGNVLQENIVSRPGRVSGSLEAKRLLREAFMGGPWKGYAKLKIKSIERS